MTDLGLQPIGANHPKIKQLRAVQRNTAPNRELLFMAEGLWAAKLLLRHNTLIDTLYWCPEAVRSTEAAAVAAELAARAADAYEISARTLDKISERDGPDGLVVLARLRSWTLDEVPLGPQSLVAVADGMNIPGNLGTLIRTLDACGAAALVLTNRRTRLTHPLVFRASQGMVLKVPVVDVADERDALAWLEAGGFDIYLAGTRDAVNYRSVPYAGRRTAFVLGAERHGLSPVWEAGPHTRVAIPMLGDADSLNVSVSAAVLLFEACAAKAGW